jgi:hypothetical protein
MVNIKDSDIKISPLEKVLVNFALPLDFVYHTVKSTIFQNEYSSQSPLERASGIAGGKIIKYHKLLKIKQNRGYLPDTIKDICKDSPCGTMRLALSYLR